MLLYQLIDGESRVCETSLVDFEENYDIVVAGLGSSGAFCALSAAMEGASVLGLERSGCMGGMATLGSVNGYYYGGIGGLFEEADKRCRELNVFMPFGSFHPDAKKYVLENMLTEAGANFRYYCVITGIYEDSGRICGVQLFREGKLSNIGCGILVDATSEGHIIRMSGADMTFGRESDGHAQPFSSVRVFITKDGKMGRTNHDSGYINQYDESLFSKAAITGNATHTQSFGNGDRLLYIAQMLGVREGKRFVGHTTLTLKDILEGSDNEDPLFYAYLDIDRHGSDYAFDEKIFKDWFMACNLSTVNIKIPVPIGTLKPLNSLGLISIGRCLSADSYAQAAVRVNRDMCRMGEAAGVLCAMTSKSGNILDADREELHTRLRKRGCFENTQKRHDFGFSIKDQVFNDVYWMTEFEDISEALKTNCPGVALWSCRRLGKEIVGDLLAGLLTEDDEMLRYNAAIALGVTEDERCLPVLREIVRNRRVFFYEDNRRTNQLRSVIAIYLLGELGDACAADELISILSTEEYNRSMYSELKEYSYKFNVVEDFNGVYFQHVSNAVASLRHIGEKNPGIREKIEEALRVFVSDDSYIERITTMPSDSSYYKMALRIREFIYG